METQLHVLIMFYHVFFQNKVIPSLMIANFTLQSCCIYLIWLREGLGLLFWSRQKTAVGFLLMGFYGLGTSFALKSYHGSQIPPSLDSQKTIPMFNKISQMVMKAKYMYGIKQFIH